MPVKPRLAHEDLDAAAQPFGRVLDGVPQFVDLVVLSHGGHSITDTGRSAELAERPTQGLGPLAGRDTGARSRERGLHDVLVTAGDAIELLQRGRGGGLIASLAPAGD